MPKSETRDLTEFPTLACSNLVTTDSNLHVIVRRFPVTQKPKRKESGRGRGGGGGGGEEKRSLAPSEVVPGYCVLHYYTTPTNKQTSKQTNKISVVFGYYKKSETKCE